MNKVILGIDAGNHSAKVVGSEGVDKFKTNISEWFVRNVKETFGDDDMEFEVDGIKGYAGSIAQYENEFGNGTIYGETKAHRDTMLRVLLAIHRYLTKYGVYDNRLSIVVGQPITGHTEIETTKIKEMLLGEHHVTINNQKRIFKIENVGVAPEGSSAYWACPKTENGTLHFIDAGSGSINAATVINGRFINTLSDTFNFGMETVSNKQNYSYISNGILSNITKLKWNNGDQTYICGGASEELVPHIVKLYPKAEVLYPHVTNPKGDTVILEPVYANAVGFYHLAKGAFE